MINLNNIEFINMLIPTDETRTELIGQKKTTLPVFKIPINLLKYNQSNGRIYLSISELKNEKNLNDLTLNEYNDEVEKLIWESNIEKNELTKISIFNHDQLNAGIVLDDGTVVDGNRRFTCIRRLNKEYPDDERFKYFRSVILKTIGEDKISQKELKTLELTVQYGQEKQLDYDIVNYAFSIYDNVVNGGFTTKEIADTVNKDENTIKTYIRTVDLINEFLDYFNQSGNIHIIRELALFFPMTALTGYLKNSKYVNGLTELDITKRKHLFFNYLAGGRFELPQQEFRDKMIKNIFVEPASFNELEKNYEDNYSEDLFFSLNEIPKNEDFVSAVKNFRASEISKEMVSDYKALNDRVIIRKEVDAPLKTLKAIISLLKTINIEPYLITQNTTSKEKLISIAAQLNEAKLIIDGLACQIKDE